MGISTVSSSGALSAIPLTKTVYPSAVPALSQTTWHINRQTGNDSADGLTTGTAVASAAEIVRRWAVVTPAVFRRIVLPAITITITWDAGATVQPDLVDPIAVLMDVDGSGGTTLILQGGGTTVSHSGTLTTASTFARNSTNGQISITETGVTDYSIYKGQIIHDKTTGAIGWIYEPQAPTSATAKITPGRTAMTNNQLVKPTPLSYAATDSYEILSLTPVYFGTGSMSRMSPTAGAPGMTFNVYMYRLWGTAQGTDGFFGDIWSPATGTSLLGRNCSIFVNECRLDQAYQIGMGNVNLVNCAMTTTNTFQNGVSGGTSSLVIFAGYAYKSPQSLLGGGEMGFDGDFVIDGNNAIVCSTGSITFLGNCSHWGTSAPAIIMDGGVYTFQFDSNVTNWIWSNGSTTSWGFNESTGKYCGNGDGTSANNTWALLDAALNAPGYGGSSAMACDPMTGSRIMVDNN